MGIRAAGWKETELTALNHFAEVLTAVDDLESWTRQEKQSLVKIIRARAAVDKRTYLKLMQKHSPLRSAVIKLESQPGV